MAIGRRLSDQGDEEVRIDLSPMIDCVFILLIFFIVTTVFVEESGIEVNRPDAAGAANSLDDADIVQLDISAQGVVRFRGRDIGVQGVRGLVEQMRVNNPEIPVLIQAEEKTPHTIFAEVYGEVRMAGAEKISFK
ncbi:MAG: biopolymer transporter ExbD [Puniceicoccaceae bacterium]